MVGRWPEGINLAQKNMINQAKIGVAGQTNCDVMGSRRAMIYMLGRKIRKMMGADIMMSEKIAQEAINIKGSIPERVNLCLRSFCRVFRGSRERSRRCMADVTARIMGVGETGMEFGTPIGDSRRASRRMGEKIIRGSEALRPEEKDGRRGSDMVLVALQSSKTSDSEKEEVRLLEMCRARKRVPGGYCLALSLGRPLPILPVAYARVSKIPSRAVLKHFTLTPLYLTVSATE